LGQLHRPRAKAHHLLKGLDLGGAGSALRQAGQRSGISGQFLHMGRQTARRCLAHEAALLGKMWADTIRPVPTINLTADELAAASSGRPARHRRRPISTCPAPRSTAGGAGKFEAAREPTPLPKAAPGSRQARAAIIAGPGRALGQSPEVSRRVPPVRFSLKC
jgi:hypothetical protein